MAGFERQPIDPTLAAGNLHGRETFVLSGNARQLSETELPTIAEHFRDSAGRTAFDNFDVTTAIQLAGHKELGKVEIDFNSNPEQYYAVIDTSPDNNSTTTEIIPLMSILSADKDVTIGRRPENDIVLNSPAVSATQARLKYDQQNGRVSLESSGTNAMFIVGITDRTPNAWDRAEARREEETLKDPIENSAAIVGDTVLNETVVVEDPHSSEKEAVESRLSKSELQLVMNLVSTINSAKLAVERNELPQEQADGFLLDASGKFFENIDLSEDAKKIAYAMDMGMLKNATLQENAAEYLSMSLPEEFVYNLADTMRTVNGMRNSMPAGSELDSGINWFIGPRMDKYVNDPELGVFALAYLGAAAAGEAVSAHYLGKLMQELHKRAV